MKSGWAQRVWGTEVPQRCLGAELRWGYEGEASRSQIYTDSLQLPNAFLRRFVAASRSSISPNPTPPKTLPICGNPMTQHGRGRVGRVGAHPCSPVATLLVLSHLSSWPPTGMSKWHLPLKKTVCHKHVWQSLLEHILTLNVRIFGQIVVCKRCRQMVREEGENSLPSGKFSGAPFC